MKHEAPRGYARVLVSAPLVVSVLVDGIKACEPLAPLPKDAVLEAVSFDALRDTLTLTFSSSKWTATLADAPDLNITYRTVPATK